MLTPLPAARGFCNPLKPHQFYLVPGRLPPPPKLKSEGRRKLLWVGARL